MDHLWIPVVHRIDRRDDNPLRVRSQLAAQNSCDLHDQCSIHLLLATDHERRKKSDAAGAAGDALVQRYTDRERHQTSHFRLLKFILGDQCMHRSARVACPFMMDAAATTDDENSKWELARL